MHYAIGRLRKKNTYKITFHNSNGIKYGSVTVYAEHPNFDSVVVSVSDYELHRELVNTVTDGHNYAYVEKVGDEFRPIRNSSDKPKYIKFLVNNYFKATARVLPIGC